MRDDGEAKKETLTELSVKRGRKRKHHHTRLHTGWCFEIMMAALGPTPATTRAYILDKYFLELEKYWEDEKNNSIRHQRSAGQSVLIINCFSSYLLSLTYHGRRIQAILYSLFLIVSLLFFRCLVSMTQNTCLTHSHSFVLSCNHRS